MTQDLQQEVARLYRAEAEMHRASEAIKRILDKALEGKRTQRAGINPMVSLVVFEKVKTIVEFVSEFHGIDRDCIWGTRRTKGFAGARQQAMAIACELIENATEAEIASAFGKHRGTLTWSVATVNNDCATNEDYRRKFELIKERCRIALTAVESFDDTSFHRATARSLEIARQA